ncbi:hypothetical protein CDL12_27566 [Handroanthus impetiginosus]|uniref:TCP domain-containing protein n=1 Tax=Handroanthus impetiginosus TaxID=429701 RepID=A0A2G9G3R0_9LAMI|nr:hypothetical protein CDL12_27566 [Handroanthus impetiginosus]
MGHRNPSRLGLKTTSGEIVEVQGGHIVRSTGRKDRHSKVCTAKGPRDRRVRLAAHTAIQFYDVQDRLGYDRPSKAVDWLIKKAKAAIDELAELPAWNPTTNVNFEKENGENNVEEDAYKADLVGSSNVSAINEEQQNSSFLPPSMDSDAIADTIKSFFPMGASDGASSSSMQFQSFPNRSHCQDLKLSLQSFQDPVMLHHHNEQEHPPAHIQGQFLLSGFDAITAWPEHHQFHGGSTPVSAGYLFNSPPAQQLLGHNQFFSQRGPLQSSTTPSVRAWVDPPVVAISAADHGHPPQPPPHHYPGVLPVYPSSVIASGFGGFTGFHIPARIQGDDEEHDGYSDKPSSASSDSRH